MEPGWKIIEPIEPPSWKFTKNITDFKDLDKKLIDDDRALSAEVDATRFSNGKAKLSNGTNPPIEIDSGELPMRGIKITGKKRSFSHTVDIEKIIEHIKNQMTIIHTISPKTDFVHPTRDLIEKALDELGKTKASKKELIQKLKEIVGRDGKIFVDDETAWKYITKLGDKKI